MFIFEFALCANSTSIDSIKIQSGLLSMIIDVLKRAIDLDRQFECILGWHPVTVKFNTASILRNVQVHMPDQRRRGQRWKTWPKSGLARSDRSKNVEFRGSRLLKKQHHPCEE